MPIGEITLQFLKKWFDEDKAEAIDDAIKLYRSSINNHEDLRDKAVELLGREDKRSISLRGLRNRIEI